ncbi:NUDIX domain-containing protein [bacterium]|nr:NUDIX domain-containing protein [bacterium]
MSEAAVRPAASVVLVRQGPEGARVLMGQRGAGAVFMPSKYVFPGGRLDTGDAADIAGLSAICHARLGQRLPPGAPGPAALVGCARRELREETGLILLPEAPLRFIFRAITPAGAPRRFDARFFLVDASSVQGDLDDFSAAEDELSHLHWVALADSRHLDLPFITEIVLAELRALLEGHEQPGVPFFDNSGPEPTFRRLV